MGKRSGRAINGVLLMDKPLGISSNYALQRVKRFFKAQKAGHTGSLDPLATGMLPICFGEATKFSQFLLDTDKTYEVTAKWGERTTTSDAEGEVIQTRDASGISVDKINQALTAFIGDIEQVPSMYSALKHQGQPLYKLARQGIEVERPARPISIFRFELLSHKGEHTSFKVHCSKGTYIRNLIEDLGEALGCGAHVSKLRRIYVGHFKDEPMYTFDQLKDLLEDLPKLDDLLLPVSAMVQMWPSIDVSTNLAVSIGQGKTVLIPGTPSDGLVRIMVNGTEFMGMGEINAGQVVPKRLMAT